MKKAKLEAKYTDLEQRHMMLLYRLVAYFSSDERERNKFVSLVDTEIERYEADHYPKDADPPLGERTLDEETLAEYDEPVTTTSGPDHPRYGRVR